MNNTENKKIFEQTWFVVLIPYLILVFIHIILGLPMKLPTIYPDEHAYLAYAKFFAGLGVSEVFKGELLGSFGYSLLIAPAFILFKNPISSYQAVIVINSFLAPTLYIVGFFFLRQVINIERKFSIIIAFLICFYPAYLLQSNSAYTESLTPTLFLLTIITFWHFLNKQNYLWSIIYSLILGLFFSVHIRIVPTILLSIFYIAFLTFRGVIERKIGIFTIFIQFFLFIIIYYIGHTLTNTFTPEYNATFQIAERLLSQVDMILLLAVLFFTWFFAVRRKFKQLIILYFSAIAGMLFEIKLLSIIIYALVWIAIILLLIIKKISIKEFFFIIVSSAFLYTLSFIVIPEIKFIGVSFQILYYWLINTIGTLYYLSVASYGLFILGILYLIYLILLRKQESGAYFKANIITTLLFVALLSFSLLFITVTPRQMTVYQGRADHMFYGRYSEVFLPIYLLFGLISFVKRDKLNYRALFVFFIAVFLLFFFILLFNYGNIIPTELAFQSVLSFFPYRAVLGNINLMLFSIATLFLLAIISFLMFKKQLLGFVFLFLLLMSFSVFTYYYTFYYYQKDVQNRTTLVSKIQLLKPYYKTLWVDKKYSMNSNAYNYAYILPNLALNYRQPNEFADSCCIVLSGPNLNSNFIDNAVPIGSENDGNDFLWVLPGPNYDFLINKYLPTYLNMNLMDSNLIGLKRTGFYKGSWINGKATFRIPLKKTDSITYIKFKVRSNNPSPQNLIIWFNNKEILNKIINKGAWEYDLQVQLSEGSNFHEIKFFSDLTQANREYVVGIELLEMRLISENYASVYKNFIKKEETEFFNFLKPTYYFIKLEDNYKIHNTTLLMKEKFLIPIQLINLDFDKNIINPSENIGISYRWRDFVFRKIQKEDKNAKIFKLSPGDKESLKLEIEAPEKPGKYFLEFDLIKDNSQWLDINSQFTPRYIVIVK